MVICHLDTVVSNVIVIMYAKSSERGAFLASSNHPVTTTFLGRMRRRWTYQTTQRWKALNGIERYIIALQGSLLLNLMVGGAAHDDEI